MMVLVSITISLSFVVCDKTQNTFFLRVISELKWEWLTKQSLPDLSTYQVTKKTKHLHVDRQVSISNTQLLHVSMREDICPKTQWNTCFN